MSLHALRRQVQARQDEHYNLVLISFRGASAAQAVSAARAVAHSYIAYVGGKNASGGKIRATLFMPANIWPRTSPPSALDTGGLGVWCGAIIGPIAAAALRRPGRRFRLT